MEVLLRGAAGQARPSRVTAVQAGAAPLQAFNRTTDPELRQRLLADVTKAAAEPQDSGTR